MQKKDLGRILTKEHERKWVALSRDHSKVVAYGDNLVEVTKEAGSQDVVYMKVPSSGTYLSFSH